jgi:O-antigen ligase
MGETNKAGRVWRCRPGWLWLGALLCGLAGIGWLGFAIQSRQQNPIDALPINLDEVVLRSGARAAMSAPVFSYSPGWRVEELGADPGEPADPWQTPSGVVTFTFEGGDLWLQVAAGDYWGYFYVTVDGGSPPNAAYSLPAIPGNVDSQGQLAAYRTFYAPEQQTPAGPSPRWIKVYEDSIDKNNGAAITREARVEVWRSWGQTPLRGVAVLGPGAGSFLSNDFIWPGVLLLVLGLWCALFAFRRQVLPHQLIRPAALPPVPRLWQFSANGLAPLPVVIAAALGAGLVAAGVALHQWWFVLAGLGSLFLISLHRPAIWLAMLLLGLPFYFRFPLPLLPWRSLSLIDIALLGGMLLMVVRNMRRYPQGRWLQVGTRYIVSLLFDSQFLLLAALISWALVATFAADHFAVALREWRTVFLSAGLFALLLIDRRQTGTETPDRHWANYNTDLWLLVGAWIAGATAIAIVALIQYFTGIDVISAEGVWRVRAFYGSPNNLALYLERTLAVSLALAIFAHSLQSRLMWGVPALVQGLALILTFSKGALLLGLPAMLATLWLGGIILLRRQGRPTKLLWWIAGAAILVGVSIVPFLGTERFQRLVDFSRGTGFLRLNLWRSSWQMALDHPLLGVGPDNFLYAYRSVYLLPAAWQEPNLNHPHNIVLDWWTRLGLPGLALAALFFANMLRRLWRSFNGLLFETENLSGRNNALIEMKPDTHPSIGPALVIGLLAATAAALAHGLIDASYALPDLMLVWVLLAFLVQTNIRLQRGTEKNGDLPASR